MKLKKEKLSDLIASVHRQLVDAKIEGHRTAVGNMEHDARKQALDMYETFKKQSFDQMQKLTEENEHLKTKNAELVAMMAEKANTVPAMTIKDSKCAGQ